MKALSSSGYVLLGLLMERPCHGYELYQAFSDPASLGQVWHLGMSHMYAELKKLEAAGMVKSTIERRDLRPPRKIFALSSTGRSAFNKWMDTPARGVREMRLEFMVRLFFARRAGRKTLSRLIVQQQNALNYELVALVPGKSKAGAGNDYAELVRKFRTSQLHAALDWLEACRKMGGRG